MPKADDLSGIEFAGLLLYFMNPVGLSLPGKICQLVLEGALNSYTCIHNITR